MPLQPLIPRRTFHALRVLLWGLIAACTGCGGCSSPTPEQVTATASTPREEDAGLKEEDFPFGVPSGGDYVIYFQIVGTPDPDNYFPEAVMVVAHLPGGAAKRRECGGVIVAPRLVLTAGHCVCRYRRLASPGAPVEYRVDGANCAQKATATVSFYEPDPSDPRKTIGSLSELHVGQVRPHPQLDLHWDEGENLLSSRADLAVIVLDTPVPVGFRAARRAKSPPKPGEPMTRVGFGYDDSRGAVDGRRLLIQSNVLKALEPAGERFLLDEPEGTIFRGDDGGPCFRWRRKRTELAGISVTGLGQESAMISLLPYEPWLREEIARAASAPTPHEPGTTP